MKATALRKGDSFRIPNRLYKGKFYVIEPKPQPAIYSALPFFCCYWPEGALQYATVWLMPKDEIERVV